MSNPCIVRAHPSLALIKYWGKQTSGLNLPATTSIAMTLDTLYTETAVWYSPVVGQDKVFIASELQPAERFYTFFANLKQTFGISGSFTAKSANNFPTGAGLASSSSGFAALACACIGAAGLDSSPSVLSSLARVGSGSASRSVYGGFTAYPAGSSDAHPLHESSHWPDLKVLAIAVSEAAKPLSSREAMERSRTTSPYYQAWLDSSQPLSAAAQSALASRDFTSLGPLLQQSYLGMFATMFTATPPVIYWLPRSLELLHFASALRSQGLAVWETMDAGPQVKLFHLSRDTAELQKAISRAFPDLKTYLAGPGPAPRFLDKPSLFAAEHPE